MSSSEPEKFFLHLLGKTGTGKSATGNSILGRKAFKAKSSASPVTEVVHTEQVFTGTRAIEVVDGPGLVDLDTGLSQDALKQFTQVITANQDSAHVFLIVCRYGERFTEEDQELIFWLREAFGSKVFKQHSIVVLTCGDKYARDTEDDGLTFHQWCKEQTGAFSNLCTWCDDRILLVDNFEKSNSFLNALEVEIVKLNYEDMKGKYLMTFSADKGVEDQPLRKPDEKEEFSGQRATVSSTIDQPSGIHDREIPGDSAKTTQRDFGMVVQQRPLWVPREDTTRRGTEVKRSINWCSVL